MLEPEGVAAVHEEPRKRTNVLRHGTCIFKVTSCGVTNTIEQRGLDVRDPSAACAQETHTARIKSEAKVCRKRWGLARLMLWSAMVAE